jgi:integrase
VTVNPTEHVDLPRAEHQEMHAMSEEEADRFLLAAEEDSLYALFAFLLGTGVRPSEAAGLKWNDLDMSTKTVSVRRTVARPKGGGWTFEQTKTKRGKRTIALPDGLISTLLEHRDTSPYSKHDLMFPAVNGEPLDMNNVRHRNFTAIRERAGLPSVFNLYSLRHTHATLLLVAGVHPKVVSERLGHATVSITLDTYSHVLPNMQKEASEKLDAMLFKRTSKSQTRAAVN